MARPNEFLHSTKQRALARQRFRCAMCGAAISAVGEAGRADHPFGERAEAHHVMHVKRDGTDSVENCVVICQACHYTAHEGGNYRFGTVAGRPSDYRYYRG